MAVGVQEKEHEGTFELAWGATGGDTPLRAYGDFQGLYESIPYKERLLEPISGGKLYIVCIDERKVGSPALLPHVENYVRMAGEGILNPNAAEDMRNAGVDGIITHLSCRAKVLYAGGEGDPDEIGVTAVNRLAKEVGVPVVQIVKPYELRTPIHDARAIYVDGTGRFDWSRVAGFPIPGFIISRGILSSPTYAQQEIDVAIEIAQGSGGFGNRFRDWSPLYLVGITDNQVGSIRSDVLSNELKEVADKHRAVAVDSIIAK